MRCYMLSVLWLATSAFIPLSTAASWRSGRRLEASETSPYYHDWFTSPITNWGTFSGGNEDKATGTAGAEGGNDEQNQGDGKEGGEKEAEPKMSRDVEAQTFLETNHLRVKARGVGNPVTNRCADLDLDVFELGRLCGSPLSQPCFDYSRCLPPPEGSGPTFYIYDYDCTLKPSSELEMLKESNQNRKPSPIWRDAANEMGVLAETYESACMFIHVNNRVDREPCAVDTPLWNYGANHFMIDLTDSGRDTRPSIANSLAMEGASNIRTCYYRSEYDMSLPLSPSKVFLQFADIPATERKYFVTVKGSVYLGGHGSEERMSLVPLHDEDEGFIMSLHCFEVHGEHLLPENLDYCTRLKTRYETHDYNDLMNTTFGLVPAGRSPGTYRLGEVMSAGAIPVFVARDIVRPFREQIDWPSFSFIFTPDQARISMAHILKAVSPEKLLDMQRKSLEAYHIIFGDDQGHSPSEGYDYVSRFTLRELQKRIGYH